VKVKLIRVQVSDQEDALLGTSFRSIRAESSGAESAGSASSVGESGGPFPGFRLGVGTVRPS
jgi:hypothetical protein